MTRSQGKVTWGGGGRVGRGVLVTQSRVIGKTISDVSRITGKQAIVQRAEPTQESVPNENVVIRVLSDGNGEHNDNSLSCYACDYENDGRWCKDVANRSLFSMTRCPNKEHVCQVCVGL